MSTSYPARRRDGLFTEELDGELLVLDQQTDAAHCLTATAAAVWQACDGNRDVEALTAFLDLSEGLVTVALTELAQLGLLQDGERVGRRQALKRFAKVGAAAGTLPLIVSALLSPPLAHASGLQSTCGTCTGAAQCVSGDTCQSGYCIPSTCVFTTTCGSGLCSVGNTAGTCTTVACGTLCCL